MLRDDSAMNLSPEFYTEFALKYDAELLEFFGGGVMHYCGKGDHFVPILAKEKALTAINLSQPHLNDMDIISGKMDFLTGIEFDVKTERFIEALGFQGGIIFSVIGDCHKVIAGFAVVCRHDKGMLLTVGACGMHMHIADIGVSADEIRVHRINGKLDQTFVVEEDTDIVFTFLFEGVNDMEATVLGGGQAIGGVIVAVGICGGNALRGGVDGNDVLRIFCESRMAASGLHRDRNFLSRGNDLGKDIVVQKLAFHQIHNSIPF